MIKCSLMIYASVCDIRTLEVPIWISVLIFGVRTLQLYLITSKQITLDSVVGLLICFSIFGISMLFSDIGGADALIAGMIGYCSGVAGIYAVLLAFLLCMPYLLWMHIKGKHPYPFVPFLTAGYLLVSLKNPLTVL